MTEQALPHLPLHSTLLTHFQLAYTSTLYIYLSVQLHIQHQLHALCAQNHVKARTLQWHRISFATDFTVAGLDIILGKGGGVIMERVIINQNLF